MNPISRRASSWAIVFSGAILLFAGSAKAGHHSAHLSAPPVSQSLIDAGAKNGATPEALTNGRQILTTSCIACHGIKSLSKYSPEKWREIVKDMGEKAKLSNEKRQDLLAYILAARESQPASPSTHSSRERE